MNDLFKWIDNNIPKALAVPTLANSFQFFALLFQYASDWNIDENELHQLLTAASGFNIVILFVVYAYVMSKRKK